MRKYEKKLHLDERYEKLKTTLRGDKINRLLLGIGGYVVLYFALQYLLTDLPDIRPWSGAAVLFSYAAIAFTKVDLAYVAFGIGIFAYAAVRLAKITEENHAAMEKDGVTPKKLLTDGCYTRVRHPMYGALILLQAGMLLSLRSLDGLVLAVLLGALFYWNGAREEKQKLIPRFGAAYEAYIRAVPGRLLAPGEWIALATALVVNLIGLM
ncbi:MAG: methyltransferase [Eubacteriales bacterium]|nr:methyltransferase [Eubacteriales bacterium]